jgi:anti-sigma regulatory factor (Ser/Thr protein kinase)
MSSVSAVFVNQRAEIGRAAEFAEQFGAAHGLSEDEVMSVNLVLDEVMANVIEHGSEAGSTHEIRVTLALEGDQLGIEVMDDARAFDPLQLAPPDLDLPLEERPVGGLGIHIVRSVMDSVAYERRDGRNIITMRKTIGRS